MDAAVFYGCFYGVLFGKAIQLRVSIKKSALSIIIDDSIKQSALSII